jgi:hypothetical protein
MAIVDSADSTVGTSCIFSRVLEACDRYEVNEKVLWDKIQPWENSPSRWTYIGMMEG